MARHQGVQNKEPATLRQELNKAGVIVALIFGIPFLTFMAYYFLAPWEIAYREHATAVYRAQIEAMPPYNTDGLQQVLVRNRDGLSVLAEYSRNELCASVLDYYRQIAPAHGWTFTRTVTRSSHTPVNNIDTSDTTDYYTGVFEGYRANLEMDCDLGYFGYSLYVTGPDLCLWSCPPPPQEARMPSAPQ